MAAVAAEREGLHHLAVVHQFQVIHGDGRAQRHAVVVAPRGELRAGPGAVEQQAEQRAVAGEAVAGLQRIERAGRVALAAGVEEHAVHADRAAQRGVVGHRIGASAGGQAQAEVEQAVPHGGGGLVVGEAHHLDVVDLAFDDVGGQLVAEHRVVRRVGQHVERMHVADQGALRVGEVGDGGIGRPRAGHRGVAVGRVALGDVVVVEVQQAEVAPETGVVLLPVQHQGLRRAGRVGVGAEAGDVRHALFLVHHQVPGDVEILGARLQREVRRCVAVVAAIVHVDVQVGADEVAVGGRQRVRHQRGGELRGVAVQQVHRAAPRRVGEAVLHPDRGLAGRHVQRARRRAVEVVRLAVLQGAVEAVVG